VDTDDTLVRQTLAGDLGAFDVLVRRHRDVVFRVAARIVGPNDAEDVAQDAMLRAFHRLRQFRGDAPFRSWLLRITHNTALNSLEKRRPERNAESVDEMELPADSPVDRARAPVANLEAGERRRRLAEKIGLLRPHHRSVLVLRDLEGLSYDEIAEVTDTPVGSVKGRIHRARGELIDLLRNNTYDWELPA
jgi:RNA polymerase sigma-70 factor (ECF subfamily)